MPEPRQVRAARPGARPVVPPSRWRDPLPGATYPMSLRDVGNAPTGAAAVSGMLGTLLALAGFFVVVPLVNVIGLQIGWLLEGDGGSQAAYSAAGQAFENVGGLVAAHLALGSMIGVVLGILAYLHHRRPTWLPSVMPGVRWRYLVVCLGVAAVVFAAAVTLRGLPAWHPQERVMAFVLAIVLTSPLQAVAEEVLFRGYLMQSLGLIVRADWFPIVGSAAIFAVFHGSQNVALFMSRFAFGVLAGVLVRLTGGLEAGIAAHVMNNLFAFVIAATTSSVAAARAMTSVPVVESVINVVTFAVIAGACWWLGRMMRVQTHVSV